MNYLRAFCERADGLEQGTGPIRFVASTEEIARDGKSLKVADWRLENYQRNPVVLWVHDYMGRNLPIGRAVEVGVEGNALVADVQFDQADEFARQVESKYRRGYLNAVSVGWQDVMVGQGKQVYHDLMDISAVPVPADPQALKIEEARAISKLSAELRAMVSGTDITDTRKAIPPHMTNKADEGVAWDGPGEVAKAEATESVLRRMHAWVDESQDPNTKRAYKLPHHTAEGWVVWRGVAAAMARLLQAGTEIPDADRRGVYNHLARHYQQFDKESPEFRTAEELSPLGEEELRGLFLEGEWDVAFGARVGAVLSARNRTDLEQAITLIQAVIERATKAEATPAEEGDKAACDEKKKRAAQDDVLLRQLHGMFTTR